MNASKNEEKAVRNKTIIYITVFKQQPLEIGISSDV